MMKPSAIAILLTATFLVRAGDEANPNFHVDVDLVQVRVAVTDRAGHYVRGLAASSFRVFENGVEQKIRSVATPANPENANTSVFVLFDTGYRPSSAVKR